MQRLVTERMQAKQWSAKDVEKRGVPHATLARYSGPVLLKSPPRESTIKALAVGLELDRAEIWKAAVATVEWSKGRVPVDGAGSAEPPQDTLREILAAIQRLEHDVADLKRRSPDSEGEQ